MVSAQLPAPLHICFFQFLYPPVKCFRASSLLQAGGHLGIIFDPFPECLIGRTDPVGFTAVRAFIIGMLDLPIPNHLPFRVWDHGTAFITDDLHHIIHQNTSKSCWLASRMTACVSYFSPSFPFSVQISSTIPMVRRSRSVKDSPTSRHRRRNSAVVISRLLLRGFF